MSKVLITGATGFIGGHLVEANLAAKNSVRALVLPDDKDAENLAARGVQIIRGDIRKYGDVRKAAEGMDIIFQCAAVVTDWAPKRLFEEVTVGGAENVCRAAYEAGVTRLVDISTNDVFGLDEEHVMDETFPLRKWGEPYPDYKIEAEKICWKYYAKSLPVTMVYPCWVYGPGDRTFVPELADAILKKELIFWRKGAIVWPTYIENLVDLLMLIAVDDRAVGNGYLVHDGESATLEEFAEGIARALNVEFTAKYMPYHVAYAAAWVMEVVWRLARKKTRPLLTTYTVKNLGSKLRFSIDKARRELGWEPKISYAEGFEKTMEWLKTLDPETLKQK